MLRLIVISLAALSLPQAVLAQSDRPNVLFIAVDDLRPELRCYGRRHMQTPNIDRLATAGVMFERAYCMVPTCGASRASLMTGVRPSRNRFVTYQAWAEKEAPRATTLNTLFRRQGYNTLSLGKVFHHAADSAKGWSEPAWHPRIPWYQLPENQRLHARRQQNDGKRGPAWESADVPDNAYADGVLAERAVKELTRLRKMDEPFFLAVGFLKPHLPFIAPKKYWDLYDATKIELPDNYYPPRNAPKESIHNSGELRAYAGIPAKGPVSDETARNLIHGYYACVSYTDAQIGKLLDALKTLQLDDNTIVVLWGDHGWNLGEHTLWCKHSCYETSMRIPLIVAAPGVQGSRRTNGLTETIDIYPTLCELAGIKPPEHLQGRSFLPLLRDPDLPWKPAAIGRYRQGDTIRTEQFRYTEYSNNRGAVTSRMLYDHKADSEENQNIAGRAESGETIKRLARALSAGMGRDANGKAP